ncbi:MinD/ParA family protein [Pueribacillus sp. YX66]|uniref:MinD/ParA family protein n=1 Tax=Pueribacillus sp. YX66 TaxID=3229242 RepID=UPI00358D5C4D
MYDQAENLRKQIERNRTGIKTKVVSVVSGKGGVGKTNISVNLAVGLSRIGKKVLVIDLDIGMANIDIITGVTPHFSIVDMIEQKLSIFDIITEGPAGIALIAGGSGLSKIFQLDAIKFSYFVRQVEQLNYHYDYILFDLGAGITKDSLNFILASHEMMIVLTPEPTSITDGYALVKAINQQQDQQLPMFLLVNSCENEDEGYETATRFKRTALQFLNVEISIVGTLPFDRTVSKAVRARIPFLIYAPKSKVSVSMDKIIYTYSGQEPIEKKGLDSFLMKLSTLFLSKVKKR